MYLTQRRSDNSSTTLPRLVSMFPRPARPTSATSTTTLPRARSASEVAVIACASPPTANSASPSGSLTARDSIRRERTPKRSWPDSAQPAIPKNSRPGSSGTSRGDGAPLACRWPGCPCVTLSATASPYDAASCAGRLTCWRLVRARGGASPPAGRPGRVGPPGPRDPAPRAALAVAARSPLLPEWPGAAFGGESDDGAPDEIARASRVPLTELRTPVLQPDLLDPARAAPEQFLNPELSWIEFNARVLALAEDPRTPPAARIRFLGIFSTNLDDFVSTKIGALKQLAALKRGGPSADQLSPQEILDAIAIRLRPLIARQYRLFDALLRSGSDGGARVAVVHWPDLSAHEHAELALQFTDRGQPFLGPKGLTRAPRHPFPA